MEEKFEKQQEIPNSLAVAGEGDAEERVEAESVDAEVIDESEAPSLNDCEALEQQVVADYVGKRLFFIVDDGETVILSDLIEVTAVTKNLTTQEVHVSLRHETTYSHNENLECDLCTLGSPNSLLKFLTKNGVTVYSNTVGVLSKYLMFEQHKLSIPGVIKFCHESLGWKYGIHGGLEGFLSANSIGMPYNSVLRGNDDRLIGPNGNRSAYEDMILKEVIPVKSLHLPFVLAFTAPIVPIMSAKADVEALLVNFAGKSSQGKSTSLTLIASVWGKGVISNDSLAVAKTFSSTFNSFEASMNDNNGFPAIFDDYESADRSLAFGELIYRLSTGSSKRRCDSKGGVQSTFNWRTFIGFSGESSIFERTDKRQGLRGRIVEFDGVVWTRDAQNAITIHETIVKHYGFYGEEFVSKLRKMSTADLENRYERNLKDIEAIVPPRTGDGVDSRQVHRLAIIKMTAELVRELMDLDIDVDYVTEQITDNEKARRESVSVFEQAKEDLEELVCKNYGSFIRYNETLQMRRIPSGQIYGRIYSGRQGLMVNILPEFFDKMMRKYNTQRKEILSKWRDEKFLICDNDGRFSKRTRLMDNMNVRTYTVVVKDFKELAKRMTEEHEVSADVIEQEDIFEMAGKAKPRDKISKDGETYIKAPKSRDIVIQSSREAHEYPEEEAKIAETKGKKQELKETPVCNTNYDDKVAFDQIFEESTDDKSKGDE